MDPEYVGLMLDRRYRATTRSGAKRTPSPPKKRTPPGKKRTAQKRKRSGKAKKSADKTFAVNRIVASRTRSRHKKPEYLTQWDNYPSPKQYTWQTEANLRGSRADKDRKMLLKFVEMKKKLAERIDAMNNAKEVEGLVSEYDKLFDFQSREAKGKITLHVTSKESGKKHTFHATKHAKHVVLETPDFWSREYLYARAKLALKMGEGMPVRETAKGVDAMGPCTYKDCLKDLVGVHRTLPRGI